MALGKVGDGLSADAQNDGGAQAVYMDDDCLSAFLWVKREDILFDAIGAVELPQAVYFELCHPRITHLRARVDAMLAKGHARLAHIIPGGEEEREYMQLTGQVLCGEGLSPQRRGEICGKIGGGEAACAVMARQRGGVIASNNFADVLSYVRRYQVPILTTGMIMARAYDARIITIPEGDRVWASMISKRRKLPAANFTGYLKMTRR